MTASTTGFERTTETDMPTDKERREVAQRLRERAGKRVLNLGELLWCIGCDDGDDAAAWNRLADLIEPDIYPDNPDKTRQGLSEPCDRDALLALADEMDAEKNFVLVGGYARRIREALGEGA